MSSVTQNASEGKRRGRGSNEGSIYKRTDVVHTKGHGDVERERWIAMVDLGVVDGRRKRHALYGTSRAEVAQKLTKVLRARDMGVQPIAGNMWQSWKRLLKRAGLPDYKFHELRHTAASLALSEGASLFHVSRMLGHGSISITADTYGQWTDEGREDVAARLERALGFGPTETVATTDGYHWFDKSLPEGEIENEIVAVRVPGGE